MSVEQHGVDARRALVLDWMFVVGVFLKGLDGLVEFLVGIPMLVITHAQLVDLARLVTADELAEDPNDLVAHLVLHASQSLGAESMLIGGIYLIVHGAVKLALVIALVRGSLRAYPWAVSALSALLVVQIVDLVVRFSALVLVLSVLDAVIVALVIHEWKRGRSLPEIIRLRTGSLRARGGPVRAAVRRWALRVRASVGVSAAVAWAWVQRGLGRHER